MRGTIHLTVQSAHLKYDLVFLRNITILKGDSATGKTTLVDMIQEYNLNGSDTGIVLSCDCPCAVIAGNTWMNQLNAVRGSLVFIDEGNRFIASEAFARAIQGTDNYYVLVTRESLYNLPYSVTEIYGFHSSGKYNYQEPVYHHMYRIYGDYAEADGGGRLLVEDSNAGFEFFSSLAKQGRTECDSARGAANIFNLLQGLENVLVIADGAAFGSQMERVYQLMARKPGIRLYLPESFEWLILSSGVLNGNDIKKILKAPAEYIDSQSYLSWERYFTQLLIDRTQDTFLKYTKSKLNPAYLQGRVCEQIVGALPRSLRDSLTKSAGKRS